MVCNLSVIQMLSGNEPQTNLAALKALLVKLSPQKNQLVLLPENALLLAEREAYLALAETLGNGYYQSQLAALARHYQCYLVCGSFPIKGNEKNKIFTSSLVFSPQGTLLCHYNKIHLFDARVSDQKGVYKESDTFIAGQDAVVFDYPFDASNYVKVGVAICYDLRFPDLFQKLRAQGAEIIVVSAAFTKVTGEAHWLPLLQARAIETQCYIVAANQGGQHPGGRETFGHSMIISPWGEVLKQLETGEGILQAGFQKQFIEQVRDAMPMSTINRL